jgi:hypothetical protein
MIAKTVFPPFSIPLHLNRVARIALASHLSRSRKIFNVFLSAKKAIMVQLFLEERSDGR